MKQRAFSSRMACGLPVLRIQYRERLFLLCVFRFLQWTRERAIEKTLGGRRCVAMAQKRKAKAKERKLASDFSSESHKAAWSDFCHFVYNSGQAGFPLDERTRTKVLQQAKDTRQTEKLRKFFLTLQGP